MGREVALGWIRYMAGLIEGTIEIMAGGSLTSIIVGLVFLSLVAAIVAIPMIVVTAWWLVTVVIGFLQRIREGI